MFRSVQAHPYHLVEPSPWPLLVSLALLTTTLSAVMTFHGFSNGPLLLKLGLLSTILTMSLWFISVTREATAQGHHSAAVRRGLTVGFLLFVVSEVFFFLSIFWAFFHSALAPTVELGSLWPPVGIEPINPFEVPLLNTVILLSSGVSVTWAHHSLIQGDRKGVLVGLLITVILAVVFTGLQAYEYWNAPFTISDGVFGSTFFMSTGFHAIHVIVGTIFLMVCLARSVMYHFTDSHHLGLESAIIYWHFVDIVWLFLFVTIYWWGGDAPMLYSSSMEVSPLSLASLLPVVYNRDTMRAVNKTASLFSPTNSTALTIWGSSMGSTLGLFSNQIPKYLAHMYLLTFHHKCVLFGIMLSFLY
jgi:cytochrome c oxidase subunit 3